MDTTFNLLHSIFLLVRQINHIHIIVTFFRNVNATKVKALKQFDEGEKPESLVGYVNERDGNGIELFEKIYDR